MQNDAMTAALLHDCGKLVLATLMPAEYHDALVTAYRESLPHWEAEAQTFGCTHAEIGAYLLGLWGLPRRVVDAVAGHHRPLDRSTPLYAAVLAVHAADAIDHDLRAPEAPSRAAALLEDARLQDVSQEWKALCASLPRQRASARVRGAGRR
jgi:HD-like signal output (HDOD) protein